MSGLRNLRIRRRRGHVWAACAAGVAALALGAAGKATSSVSTGARGGDGRILFQSNRGDGNIDVYAMDADSSNVQRLTFDQAVDRRARWSPDSTRIAFVSNRDGNSEVYVMNADGLDQTRITNDSAFDWEPDWTADGRIVFQRGPFDCSSECALWIANPDGTGAGALDLGPGSEMNAAPAPHGDKIAFASNRGDGKWRIYTARLDGNAVKRVTETAGAAFGDFRPRWSPNGNDLVFMRDVDLVQNDIWTVHADGSGLQQVTSTDRFEEQADWSHAGSRLIFGVFPAGGPPRLHTIAPDGSDDRERPLQAAPVTDEFSDGVRDASLWHEVVTGTETTIVESDGRIEISIGVAAEPGGPFNAIDGHYGSQCRLPADFDMQVRYELLTWPATNGVQAALDAFFANAFVWRESKPWGERYFAFIEPVGGGFDTSDTAGAFRLVRKDGMVTAYVRSGTAWNAVLTAPRAGDAVYGFGASAFPNTWSHQGVVVAFDDFLLHSGELQCPDWWSASFPDWAGDAASAPPEPPSTTRGELVFQSNRADNNMEIWRMNDDGTEPRRLTFHHALDRDPSWSPDGSQIAFRSNRASTGFADDEIWVMNADGSGQRQLTFNDVRDGFPRWTEDGRIVFARGFVSNCCDAGDLWRIDPVTLVETRLTTHPAADHLPDTAPRGTKVAFGSDRSGTHDIWTLNTEDGSLRRVTSGSPLDFNPVWSPTANELMFLRDVDGSDNDIYAVRADGGGLQQITDTPARAEFFPSWAPEGDRIAFAATENGETHVYVANPDGSHASRLTASGVNTYPDWRPQPAVDGAVNLARGRPVTASLSNQFPPELAVDGVELLPWLFNWWGAGAYAPQWIEIDLGAPSAVGRLRFVAEQSPPGNTVHEVYGRGSSSEPWQLLHVFSGYTTAAQVLDYRAPAPWANVRHVRVLTVSSPSWVAWRELEVISPG